MALMFPVTEDRSTAVAPVTMRRPFRVFHECPACGTPASTDMRMIDEVDDAATVDDFIASGALNRLRPFCARCGCESTMVTDISYIRQPTDATGA